MVATNGEGRRGGKLRTGAAGATGRWLREPLEFSNLNRGRSTQEHQKALARRRAGSRSPLLEVTWKHIDELSLVFA